MIDPTINLGVIVSIGSSILLGGGFVWAIKSAVSVLEVRLTIQDKAIVSMQDDIKALSAVTTAQAVQRSEIGSIREAHIAQGKRLDEALSRFNRWIDSKVKE